MQKYKEFVGSITPPLKSLRKYLIMGIRRKLVSPYSAYFIVKRTKLLRFDITALLFFLYLCTRIMML